MSKHTLSHWKYMHDRARSLCMITDILPLSQYSLLFTLFTFHTLRSPYRRVEQAKCIMGIMPTPQVAFSSQGLGTSAWGGSEPGTDTLECTVCHLIGWRLYREWLWVTCEAITSPQKPIPVQWVAVRIQRKRNSLQTVRVKPTVVIRTLLWPRNISKCERVRSTRHGTGRGGEGVLSLLLLEYAVCHFCFLVHGLPSFFKNNYQGSLEVSWTKR